jgi:hypothetical protein
MTSAWPPGLRTRTIDDTPVSRTDNVTPSTPKKLFMVNNKSNALIHMKHQLTRVCSDFGGGCISLSTLFKEMIYGLHLYTKGHKIPKPISHADPSQWSRRKLLKLWLSQAHCWLPKLHHGNEKHSWSPAWSTHISLLDIESTPSSCTRFQMIYFVPDSKHTPSLLGEWERATSLSSSVENTILSSSRNQWLSTITLPLSITRPSCLPGKLFSLLEYIILCQEDITKLSRDSIAPLLTYSLPI